MRQPFRACKSWHGPGSAMPRAGIWPQVTRILRMIAIAGALCFPNAAAAEGKVHVEVPRGLWQTEPDMGSVVFYVRTRQCGRALCGRVERAKNSRGYDTPSNAVGAKVLQALLPQPDGSFVGAYTGPQAHQYPLAHVVVSGQTLKLRTCLEDQCHDQVWTRIR